MTAKVAPICAAIVFTSVVGAVFAEPAVINVPVRVSPTVKGDPPTTVKDHTGAPSAGQVPQSSPTSPSDDNKIPVADADAFVRLINNQYGAICSVTLEGWFSRTLKVDWTSSTKVLHAMLVFAAIGNAKDALYVGGVRHLKFPNDAGGYNVIDWKTGEKTSVSERAPYYLSIPDAATSVETERRTKEAKEAVNRFKKTQADLELKQLQAECKREKESKWGECLSEGRCPSWMSRQRCSDFASLRQKCEAQGWWNIYESWRPDRIDSSYDPCR
jgi:hypothetical protein